MSTYEVLFLMLTSTELMLNMFNTLIALLSLIIVILMDKRK
ncbi:hypothetical protein [Clostridium sp. MD294]|nr:hypothetical protein [Clostridium sp. MD294]USF30364.1 hypothetical protein C820_001805 [Clostridium sp. MD294]